jgi:tetratricopeptide (TPR) repeat protein
MAASMSCGQCGSDRPAVGGICPTCGAAVSAAAVIASDAPTIAHGSASRSNAVDAETSAGPARPSGATAGAPIGPLTPGQEFGPRYRILKALGAGGMGAVYQAWDEELSVAVALKVIRPEVLAEPMTAREVERRFKRELLLARQVTHRNVVRIHDLGEIHGIKYLTMPYIQGSDLADVLKREGRLPLGRALAVAKQVASGLVAAHQVGVVHRDLKPENIMIDTDGTAVIMDFGIARSVSGTGTSTQFGHVMGTLEYMSPEQAQGQPVDQRADIYAFGLILYDMLGGRWRTSQHENPMSELMARLTMDQALPPVKVVAPEATSAVDAIITRCLKIDPGKRYQTSAELLADLANLDQGGRPFAAAATRGWRATRWPTWLAAALTAVALSALGGAWWLVGQRATPLPAATRPPVKVLIANFENKANDPVFDGLIEQALSVGIEGASFVTAYPRQAALQLAAQLPGGVLNVDNARLISLREGIDVVLGGGIAAKGRQYLLTVRAIEPEPDRDRVVLDWGTDAAGKEQVLAAVGRMAAKVRNELGDSSADTESVRNEETFTARSLEAAHAYVAAQELQWAGKQEEAIGAYQKAIQLDPDLGRAYAGLGAVTAALGRRQEAEQYYQEAFKRFDRMTDREKFRTRGGFYLITQNAVRASEEFEQLVKQYPADTSGLANLAFALVLLRDFDRALDVGRKASAIFPNNVLRRNNVALYAMYAGKFEDAEREANGVLALNKDYAKAYVALGLSRLATGRVGEAADTYRRLSAVSAAGKTFATHGLADLALYQGRLGDAASILQEAIGAGPGGGSTAARLRVTLAEVRLAQGRAPEALQLADQAVAQSNEQAVTFLAGRVMLHSGRQARAAELAADLARRLDQPAQVLGALLDGETALKLGRGREALSRFTDAQKMTDTWLGRFDLGLAYLQMDSFLDADAQFDNCLNRRGEATAVFLDDIPSYRFLAPVHYYLGRAREGLKNPRAADAYRAFLAINERADEQGLVTDARRRLTER